MHQEEVLAKDVVWKMLVNWLDAFPAVLEVHLIHLEMTTLVLESAEPRTLETRHNCLGGDHILPTMAPNLGSLTWH
jgi:hypothetical protein